MLLLLAAILLSWALADPAAARSGVFQSSILESPLETATTPPGQATQTPTATAAAPGLATQTPTATAALPGLATAPATFTPLPTLAPPTLAPTPAPSPTATPIGFLPPPTMTSPETPTSLPSPTRSSVLETRLAARATRVQTPTPAAGALRSGGLLDTGVTALGYLWLFCGIVLLVAAAVGVVWLMRRKPPVP